MNILKLIWQDIRQGENIDLYVTVTIAIVLAGLGVAGVSFQDWIAPVTLSVLALLAISMVGTRHRLETIIQIMTQSPESLFLKTFPDSYINDMTNAKEMWLVGMNLMRTIYTHYADLETKLKKGNSIKVLILKPDGDANKLAAFRSYTPTTPEEHRQRVMITLSNLCKLKKISPDKLEIRILDFPITFGAMAADPDTLEGVIYLEHYAFKVQGDRPKIILRSKDGYWYKRFRMQIAVWWENSEIWDCSRVDSMK